MKNSSDVLKASEVLFSIFKPYFYMLSIFNLFVFLLLSAQILNAQEIIKIDPERMSRGTLTLSDLVASIEYIPLETNRSCLIGEIRRSEHLKISDNYILVYCNTSQSFYLFNRAGEFITKIGSRGRGPGEYLLGATPFAIDEKNWQVIIANTIGSNTGQLIYYDMNGKHVRSVSVDGRFVGAIPSVQFDDKYIAMHLNNPFKEGDPPFNYSIFSNDYKLITQKIKNVDYISTQQMAGTFIGEYYIYFYNGQLHVKNAVLNDTVYSISKNLSFFPKYIINFGSYSFTSQVLSDPELYRRVVHNHTLLRSVFETNNYVLISYMFKEKYFYQYYDKSQRRSMLFHSTSGIPGDYFGLEFANGIPNDYDGGLDFWPKQQNGNEFISWHNAYLFEENENKMKPKGPSKAVNYFEETVHNMAPKNLPPQTEANPIVVIVKFKQ